jgi:hypothetical protein
MHHQLSVPYKRKTVHGLLFFSLAISKLSPLTDYASYPYSDFSHLGQLRYAVRVEIFIAHCPSLHVGECPYCNFQPIGLQDETKVHPFVDLNFVTVLCRRPLSSLGEGPCQIQLPFWQLLAWLDVAFHGDEGERKHRLF